MALNSTWSCTSTWNVILCTMKSQVPTITLTNSRIVPVYYVLLFFTRNWTTSQLTLCVGQTGGFPELLSWTVCERPHFINAVFKIVGRWKQRAWILWIHHFHTQELCDFIMTRRFQTSLITSGYLSVHIRVTRFRAAQIGLHILPHPPRGLCWIVQRRMSRR